MSGDDDDSVRHLVLDSFFSHEVSNPVVMGVVLALMAIIVSVCCVVTILDRYRNPKRCLHLPLGEPVEGRWQYVVSVGTGLRRHAGLDAGGLVQITVNGRSAISRPLIIRNLKDGDSALLRGSVDNFILPSEVDLGELDSVCVDFFSLDKQSINWYVKYIRVTDVTSGEDTYFLFDRWMRSCDYLRTTVHRTPVSSLRIFAETFLSEFSDLNVWTSFWLKSKGVTAFTRSLNVALCGSISSSIMLGCLFVCILPYISEKHQLKDRNPQLYNPWKLFAFSLLSTAIIAVFHYCLEILLRNIRTSKHDADLRDPYWSEKSWSLIPQGGRTDSFSSQNPSSERTLSEGHRPPSPTSFGRSKRGSTRSAPTVSLRRSSKTGSVRQVRRESRSEMKPSEKAANVIDAKDGRDSPDSGRMAKDIFKHWERLTQRQDNEYHSLAAVVENEENEPPQRQPNSFLMRQLNESAFTIESDSDTNNEIFKTPEVGIRNSNTNGNRALADATADVEESLPNDYVTTVKRLLWDRKEGVVSKYIESNAKGACKSEKASNSTDCKISDHAFRQFAQAIVDSIVKEVRVEMAEGRQSHDNLRPLQEEMGKFLKEQNHPVDNSSTMAPTQGSSMHSHKSDGNFELFAVGGTPLRPTAPSSQSLPSSTSSCPEVVSIHGSVSNEKATLGPVASRLSDSVTAIAFKNSFESIENTTSAKLDAQSAERRQSFTSLSNLLGLPSDDSVFATVSEEKADTHHSGKGTISMTNLIDFITEERVDRLSEENMKHIATASLRNILSDEKLQRMQSMANDFSTKSLKSFTYEVVNNLYTVVRSKLENMLVAEDRQMPLSDEVNKKVFDDLLQNADEEVKTMVLPSLVDYVTSLLKQQSQSLADIDVELMMMAFSGQYIDTIVTNAVLQTHVGLLKAKKSLTEIKDEVRPGTTFGSDSNENNNTDVLQSALATLEQTAEVKDIITQLSDYMTKRYIEISPFQPGDEQNKIRLTFKALVSTYDTFERVLVEASEYMRLMSERCDLYMLHKDSMMSELSELFLVNGLDVLGQVSLVETLSEKLMEKSVQHACAVVGEDILQQYLQREDTKLGKQRVNFVEDICIGPDAQGHTPPRQGRATGRPTTTEQVASMNDLKNTNSTSLLSEAISNMRDVREILVGTVGGNDQTDVVPDQSLSENVHLQMVEGKESTLGEDQVDFHSWSPSAQRSPFVSPIKTNFTSPIRSSTPVSSVDHTDTSFKGSPKKPVDGETSVVMSQSETESSLMSIPLLPKDPSSMQSYLTTEPSILGDTPSSQCLVYVVSRAGETPTCLETQLQSVWALSVEREVAGHSTKCLPPCTAHILQLIMVAMTIASMTTCLLFGIRLSNQVALQWLILTLISLTQHVVMETGKVFMYAFFSSYCRCESN